MKKKVVSMLLMLAVSTQVLAGCAGRADSSQGGTAAGNEAGGTIVKTDKNDQPEEPTGGQDTDTETAQPENTKPKLEIEDETEAAFSLFQKYLAGEVTATNGEKITETYREYGFGIPEGAYTIFELQEFVEEDQPVVNSEISYVMMYLQDDTPVCFVQFESTEPSMMNWIGILTEKNGELVVTDSYMDGYRTFANLYENGFLADGGSASAGEYVTTMSCIEEGYIVPYRTVLECYGYWIAEEIRYCAPFPELVDEIDLSEDSPYHLYPIDDSNLCVYFLKSGDDLKVAIGAPDGENNDAAEDMYETLKYLGFIIADVSEVFDYQSYGREGVEEVSWTKL